MVFVLLIVKNFLSVIAVYAKKAENLHAGIFFIARWWQTTMI